MSLGNLTLLLEELWAFALLKSGLAEPRKSAEGGWTIRSSEGVWKALLEGGGSILLLSVSENPHSSKQLTDGVEPPANRGIRQEQGALYDDPLVLANETWIEIEDDVPAMMKLEEHLEATKDWINFHLLAEEPKSYKNEDKVGSGDGNSSPESAN
ncbi:hypothetical protein THAOC_14047 [Thalassiosira oceanica]|uniref:Uncharacterized protein n=1 Tax=Thalassiosira oceanica TaxID=159749 RepID=K0SW01_THAOC|nr:hypothetical protein THAOC_14047 [Thalassiosira oceanica]|eukprot:EJK65136.1 hypothetical protein THAOC_14047 [Thalassiosira oceanica]